MEEAEVNFRNLMAEIEEKNAFPEGIKRVGKRYEVNLPQLTKINPIELARLRQIVLEKLDQDADFRQKVKGQWNECEKKIFNWVSFSYSFLRQRSLEQLDDSQLEYLGRITTRKSLALVKYHVLSLMEQELRPKWSALEDANLKSIFQKQQFKPQGEWLHISRELFLRGDHQHYKSPKNCRQRWFNHVNPLLSKRWTPEQDRKLMQGIQEHGKKWAMISSLQTTKNEHMVKNRYHSILKKMQKKYAQTLSEDRLIELFLQIEKKGALGDSQSQKQQQVSSQSADVVPCKIQNSHIITPPPIPMSVQKEVKPQVVEMKLFSSFQYYPRTEQDKGFILQGDWSGLDSSKLFKEEAEEKEEPRHDILKLSQSYNYSLGYPSPVPVTPGCELFSVNTDTGFRGGVKMHFKDFLEPKHQ